MSEVTAEHWAAYVRAQIAYYGSALATLRYSSLDTVRLRAFLLGAMWSEIGRHLGVWDAR